MFNNFKFAYLITFQNYINNSDLYNYGVIKSNRIKLFNMRGGYSGSKPLDF